MTILNRPIDAVLNVIKVMSMSSLLLINFEVEWHNLRSDKLYQCQGYEHKLLVCHCNFGGEGEGGGWLLWATIQFPTNALKTYLRGTMSNTIKDLSVSSSWFWGWSGIAHYPTAAQLLVVERVVGGHDPLKKIVHSYCP